MRRRLLLGGRGRWSDAFDGAALGPRWTVLRGTPTVSGGKVVGGTLEADGYNTVPNPEFTSGYSGTLIYNCTPVWVDSVVDPGSISPGDDAFCLKTVAIVAGEDLLWIKKPATVLHASYQYGFYAFVPSSNVIENNIRATNDGLGPAVAITAEDTWLLLQASGVANTASPSMRCEQVTAQVDDVAYADKVFCIRRSSLFIALAWPNLRFRAVVTTPASSVCPLHLVFRCLDELTYTEVRLAPGTAGNDTHIIERVAGVETIRASADLDYAPSTDYEVRVDAKGSNAAVYVNGALAASYASAIGQAYRNVGLEFLDASGWAVKNLAVEEL